MKKNIIIINSHPIQYFTPLYRELSKYFNVKVLYCSDLGVKTFYDNSFAALIKWDIPLLDGYSYKFLKNYSFKHSFTFFGLINLGILKELFYAPSGSIIWVHSWAYFTNFIAIIFGRILGHRIVIRSDANINDELNKLKTLGNFKITIKKILLSTLFKFANNVFVIGKRNSKFYDFYKVEESKKIPSPFCVDNDRFINYYNLNKHLKNKFRLDLNIEENKIVLICSGKIIRLKRYIDVLKACKILDDNRYFIIFIGDGPERHNLEAFAVANQYCNFLITGFINQTEICKYYLVGDLYVMSSDREAWGLSTNEAMCFNLPIILSDAIGCVDDLLTENTGYSYPCGDVESLALRIKDVTQKYIIKRHECHSMRHIQEYSFDKIIKILTTEFNDK